MGGIIITQRTKTILGMIGFAALLAGAVLAYNVLRKQVQPGIDPTRTQAQIEAATRQQKAAPDFTVTDAEGNSFRLSDFRGNPVVLNFWASWCPPCRSEMPEFDRLHKELGGQVHFMMVDLVDGYSETVDAGARFIRDQGYAFPVFFDTKSEAAAAYGVSGIPATFFIDSEGYVVSNAVGALNESSLRAGIEKILP